MLNSLGGDICIYSANPLSLRERIRVRGDFFIPCQQACFVEVGPSINENVAAQPLSPPEIFDARRSSPGGRGSGGHFLQVAAI